MLAARGKKRRDCSNSPPGNGPYAARRERVKLPHRTERAEEPFARVDRGDLCRPRAQGLPPTGGREPFANHCGRATRVGSHVDQDGRGAASNSSYRSSRLVTVRGPSCTARWAPKTICRKDGTRNKCTDVCYESGCVAGVRHRVQLGPRGDVRGRAPSGREPGADQLRGRTAVALVRAARHPVAQISHQPRATRAMVSQASSEEVSLHICPRAEFRRRIRGQQRTPSLNGIPGESLNRTDPMNNSNFASHATEIRCARPAPEIPKRVRVTRRV